MKIAYSDYRAHGTRLLLMGMVNIAALTIEARFLTNLTADQSHGISLEQTLRENVLPERSHLGQFRGQIQNARLLNDIVYRRVVPLPDLTSAIGHWVVQELWRESSVVIGGLAGIISGWALGQWMAKVNHFPLIAGLIHFLIPMDFGNN
jgi:hypothetical protein